MKISVYPNPSSGKFNIAVDNAVDGLVRLSIYGLQGKRAAYKTIQSNEG